MKFVEVKLGLQEKGDKVKFKVLKRKERIGV